MEIKKCLYPFNYKQYKILSSQNKNHFFGDQTIKFNYAVKTCILGKVFWQIRFWTFFLSIFEFPKILFNKKTAWSFTECSTEKKLNFSLFPTLCSIWHIRSSRAACLLQANQILVHDPTNKSNNRD